MSRECAFPAGAARPEAHPARPDQAALYGEAQGLHALQAAAEERPDGRPDPRRVPADGAADALPFGPRACGYRLKENYPGEYGKGDFKRIEEIIKRLAQADKIPFGWVADASAVTYGVGSDSSPVDFLRHAHELYERDLRDGQPVVIEIVAEARETLPLIGASPTSGAC